jgi:hypothetical protein
MKAEREMRNLIETKYKKYEVASRNCSINLLDTVTPETVIGCHYGNKRPIRSELHGRVATMYYNPRHDSLIVMVVASGDWPSDTNKSCLINEALTIPGLYVG